MFSFKRRKYLVIRWLWSKELNEVSWWDISRKKASPKERQAVQGPEAGERGMFEGQHGGWYIWRRVIKLLTDLWGQRDNRGEACHVNHCGEAMGRPCDFILSEKGRHERILTDCFGCHGDYRPWWSSWREGITFSSITRLRREMMEDETRLVAVETRYWI